MGAALQITLSIVFSIWRSATLYVKSSLPRAVDEGLLFRVLFYPVIESHARCDYEVCQELVLRVVSSSYINKSARLRELLLYLCKRVLDESADDIHELEVGHNVFGRPKNYDTGADNIVRVHASLLRKRLSEYFSTEGREEPLTIEIPRGNYAPIFLTRTIATSTASEIVSAPSSVSHAQPRENAVAATQEDAWEPLRSSMHVRGWTIWIPTAFSVLLGSLSIILLIGSQRGRQPEPINGTFATSAASQFWSQLFHPGQSTEIVLDDASLNFYQAVTSHPIALAEYFDRSYLQSMQATAAATGLNLKLVNALMLERRSSYADASLIGKLTQTADGLKSNADIQFARDFSFRQVKSGNVILLGSSQSNPWIQPFESHLTLRWKFDSLFGTYFPSDTTTPAGQQDAYRIAAEAGGEHEGFATVSFLPNLGGTGNVLIISGTGGTAIGAAIDFLSNSVTADQLRSRLPQKPGSAFPYFEALLEVEKGTGLPRQVAIVIDRSPSGLAR
jgi:hypothetical protein